MGSHHRDESFGDDFVLPPDRAYSETCAGVASVMLSWRLLLATGDPRYADLVERTLFNVVATSPSDEGTGLLLRQHPAPRRPGRGAAAGREPSPARSTSLRAPWFAVSCCPTNVARTLASLAALSRDGRRRRRAAAPVRAGEHLHDAAGRAAGRAGGADRVPGGRRGPRTGAVRRPAAVDAEPAGADLGGWRAGWSRSRSRATPYSRTVRPGRRVGDPRRSTSGDVVELHLPLAPRYTAADPRVDAVRGCLAVERGPEVLCLESVDLSARGGARGRRRAGRAGRRQPAARGGRRGRRPAARRCPRRLGRWVAVRRPGDQPASTGRPRTFDVALVAYHDWANRGPSTMRVWLPVAD